MASIRYNVKYMAITPLMGLVWAKCRKQFLKACKHGSEDDADWGPLAVLIGQVWGLQLPVRELRINSGFKLDLLKAFKAELENNKNRWEGESIDTDKAIKNFKTFFSKFKETPNFSGNLTAEAWLYRILNQKPFTEDLTKLFGGETRLSLGSRGVWYDGKNQRFEDLNIIVEFCGRRGIVAREAIREQVVSYLKDQGAEEMVLFQEIPLQAYLE